jgi:hypothetical protein
VVTNVSNKTPALLVVTKRDQLGCRKSELMMELRLAESRACRYCGENGHGYYPAFRMRCGGAQNNKKRTVFFSIISIL